MLHKLNSAKILAIFAMTIITLKANYALENEDPFAQYRAPINEPIIAKKQELKHYNNEDKLISEKLKLNLSPKERSILRALKWLLVPFDDDKNFKPIFSDFLLLMGSLKNSRGRIHQKEVVEAIIKKSLLRAQDYLSELFDDSEAKGWHFIALFPLLAKYPNLKKKYLNFYKGKWPKLHLSKAPDSKDFINAMKNTNYRHMFFLLFITSFAYHQKQNHKQIDVKIPKDNNKFITYLKEFENFSYKDHPLGDSNLRDLGYLATHIPLFLTNYGELPLSPGTHTMKVKKYIESSLEKVKKLGDFDLFAEYIQCLKMFNPKDSRIPELERFLYELQRQDGSWGSASDFRTAPYTIIHPTGAALMALNQS